MIKAIFFDWFNTLARFEPPREKLHSQAFQQLGIEMPLDKVMRGLLVADKNWFEENARTKVEQRSPEEQAELAVRYEETILDEAGIKASRETLLKVVERINQLYRGLTFVLFDDVLSTLKTLKGRSFILGLLTNVAKEMNAICRGLGLEPYLDFIVTSQEVGADKPQPPIFLTALERAGVSAAEAVHVGDQYKLDAVGARGVGITPILIDRYDLYPEVSDCPRIRTLPELANYI
jgi:putative hydrolase of the HAD superfamily